MSADHAVELEYVVFDGSRSTGRFACEDIEPGSQTTLLHGSRKRGLIDYFSARGVDEVRAGLHCIEEFFVDQIPRVIVERDVNADDVRRGGDFKRRLFHIDAESLRAFECKRAAPSGDRHAEGFCSRNHLVADSSQTNQPQSAPEDAARPAVLLLVPAALPQVRDIIRYSPVER